MTATLSRVFPPCVQGPDSYHYGEDAWLTSSASFNPYQCDFAKLEVCVHWLTQVHGKNNSTVPIRVVIILTTIHYIVAMVSIVAMPLP